MKTRLLIILASLTAPTLAHAINPIQDNLQDRYQELCAKERDPVKRHNYCYMIENSNRSHVQTSVFNSNTAVV